MIETAARPQAGEYNPYYDRYISLVRGDDVLAALDQQGRAFAAMISSHSEKDGDFRYAPEKWSIKEVVGHVTDTERIFAYRALRVARADQTPIEGFEQDDYVKQGPFASCSLSSLLQEFHAVHEATLALLRNLRPEDWTRRGMANKHAITVRALAWIAAGHIQHHRNVLMEEYAPHFQASAAHAGGPGDARGI